MAENSDTAPARPRRSRWRFGLFSLFILIAIAAIAIRGLQIGSARAHTAAALATTTTFDFLDTPLVDILDLLRTRNDLRIQTEMPDQGWLVTYRSQAPLSQVLTEILDEFDCEYAVTFDGAIVVRNKVTE